jgi:hypothetical protein
MRKGWFNGIRVYVMGSAPYYGTTILKMRPVRLGPGEYTFTALADAVSIDK